MDFLKKRAKEFYSNALEIFEKKVYNLSAFNLEQATQLWLKYLIAKKLGEWSQTHYLDELLDKLTETYEKQEILKFKEDNELFFDELSGAYFQSRYYPKEYNENLVKKLFEGFESFIKFIEGTLNEKFNYY